MRAFHENSDRTHDKKKNLLSVKVVTLILISGRGSVILSAIQEIRI